MPQRAWSAKRERQYEHVKEGLRSRGRSESTAEEIAHRDRQPKEAAQSAPARVYALGRLGRWVGRLFGGDGRRTGARDTDPGH